MNKKLSFILFFSSLILSIFLPQSALAKNIKEEIKETGILKIGVREDSPLFGFGKKKEGYCVDFAQELAEYLSLSFNKEITVNFVTSNNENRWDLVNSGKVHLECGPNTINQAREKQYNIKFSQPFFVTATQVLMKLGNNNTTFSNSTIGYAPATTTETELKQVYPHEQLNDAYSDISEGILAVEKGKLVGFASDGILLIGTASSLNLSPENFNLVTPMNNNRPFCAAYGMILPAGENHINWQNTVNDLILKNGQGDEVWNRWFLNFLPYLTSVLKSCG